MKATVITDASWCPETGAGGWAVWITLNTFYSNGTPRTVRIKRYGTFRRKPAHSTEAEVWAAYNGLWIAYSHGARNILCQTDCVGAIQRNHTEMFTKYLEGASIQWRHVKGHTSRDEPRYYVNRWCDKKARAAMRRQRGEIR